MAIVTHNPLVRLLRAVLLILLSLLVAELAWLFLMMPTSADSNRQAPVDYQVAPPAIVPMAEREAFTESIERSLFSWNRRPKVTEQQPVSEDGQLSSWLLSGIVNTGTATYAIFSHKESDQRLRLQQGMYLEKWKIISMSAEQVTLSDGDDTEVFYLRATEQPPSPERRVQRESEDED